jgi:DNA uptake protein ComE-like DNA-binding protein
VASVLVGLLWCVALLSVVVIGVLHLTRLDLLVVKNHGDRIQARYLALAGIEKAKALLYQEARSRSRSGRNHSGGLYDAPAHFRQAQLGRGHFQVFRQGRADEGGGLIHGVSDEESRLNVNQAGPEELRKLEGMTPDIVAAIVDWRDRDNQVTAGGAEADYYASFQPPYQPRNGPFQTVRELLMVRGISRDLLLGRDADLKLALPSDGPEDAGQPAPNPGGGGLLEAGWASVLAVNSSVEDVNAAGQDRLNIQSADENALTAVKGITREIAKAIVAHRGQNRFQSIADLLDVTAVQEQGQNPLQGGSAQPQAQGGQPAGPVPGRGSPAPNPAGPKVVSETLLVDLADDLTVQSDASQPGAVNINTAGLEVLACLPGMTRELAQAVVNQRQSAGFYPNIAGVLRVPGFNAALFKQIAPRITARSETFRILSEGKVPSSGARQRIEAVVHVGLRGIQTLSYREDDL